MIVSSQPMVRALGLVVGLSIAFTAPDAWGSTRVGGDACALIEGMPLPGHPLRSHRRLKRAYGLLDDARSPARYGRAYRRLEGVVSGLLDKATRIFHPRRGAIRTRDAQRFLKAHVLGPNPLLRVADAGFAPEPPVRASLMYAACRAGDHDAALAWARRASGADEGGLRAFGALLLWERDDVEGAREMLGDLAGDGGSFLRAWLGGELAATLAARRSSHARAARRAATPAQAEALRRQARRLQAP